MVNERFPERIRYGFEMVDAPVAAISLVKSAINRKFTPNRIIRIFRKFSPV
jgi:hypothetical protein